MKKVYILNGSATSGKNTFVDICNKFVATLHYSYIDYARYKIAPLCGYQGGKSEWERNFLSDLNDLLIKYYDLPFKDISEQIDFFLEMDITEDGKNSIMFVDIREPEAIRRACEVFNAKAILIENNRVQPVISNHADANVRDYEYDYIIENNGDLNDLIDGVQTFLTEEMII